MLHKFHKGKVLFDSHFNFLKEYEKILLNF